MKKFIYFIGYAIAFAVIFTASTALAATPQEILNKSLAAYDPNGGINMAGEMYVNVHEERTDGNDLNGPENVTMNFTFLQRSLPKQNGFQDGEGRFTIKNMRVSDAETSFDLNEPVSFHWRTVAQNAYFKVGLLPESVQQTLQAAEIDLTPLTQRWFFIQSPAGDTELQNMLPNMTPAQENPMQAVGDVFQVLDDKPFLKVTSIEKTFKNHYGHEIVRVRLGVNKDLMYRDYQKNLSEANKITNTTERATAIQDIKDEYADDVENSAKLHMAANLNMTAGWMERLEFGMQETEPTQDCVDLKGCVTVGQKTSTIRAGIWIRPIDTRPIYIPYNAKSMEELGSLFQNMFNL